MLASSGMTALNVCSLEASDGPAGVVGLERARA
jgi:hypothetical protein